MRSTAGIALGALSFLAACTASSRGDVSATQTAPSTAAHAETEVTPGVRPAFDVSSVVARVRATFRPDGAGYESRAANFALRVDCTQGVSFAPRHYLPAPAHTLSASEIARGALTGSPQATLRPGAAMAAHMRSVRRDGAPVQFTTQSMRIGTTALDTTATRTLVSPDGATEIQRGDVVERVHNQFTSVEQSWRIDRRPSAHGDLVVRVAVSGEDFAGQSASGLHFADAATGVGVRYGSATWVDGASRRTDLAVRWDNGAIEITVPASVVENSAYPAVLDPTISPEFGIDTAAGTAGRTEELPTVAFDGTNYLVVWSDDRNKLGGNENTWDLYGARVSQTGTVLDTSGIAIGTSATKQYFSPTVAFDGTNYLVAWVDDDQTAGTDIVTGSIVTKSGVASAPIGISTDPTITGQFSLSPIAVGNPAGGFFVVWQEGLNIWVVRSTTVNAAGSPGALLTLSGPNVNAIRPYADFDGTNFLAVWADNTNGTAMHIMGRRVSTSNAAIETAAVKITSVTPSPTGVTQAAPTVSWTGSNYFAAWQEGASGSEDIHGRHVDATLTATDANDIVIANSAGAEQNVHAARYGASSLVVWDDNSAGASNRNILGRTVSAASVLGSPLALASSAGDEQSPAVAAGAGTSALVVFQNGNYVGARSTGVLVSSSLSVTTDKTSYASTDPVVITWDGMPGNQTDWIAVAAVGSADNVSDQSFYLNGQISGTRTVTGLSAGTYELRAYYNYPTGGYTVQARSPSFTIAGQTVTLTSDASTYVAGTPIVVSWSGMPTNSTDWIAVALVGSASNVDSAEFYTGGLSSGMHTIAGLPAGTYEIRAYYNWPSGGYTIRGTSAMSFTVTPSTAMVTLTTDKTSYANGEAVQVCWTNMPGANTDWISVAPQGSASDVSDAQFYTNGQQSGCQTVTGLPGGTYNYELRAYYNWPSGGYTIHATSSTFSYAAAAPLTLSTDLSTYLVGQPVTVTWSGFPGNQTDWIAIAKTSAPNGTDTQEFYVNGLRNGSQQVLNLPAGTYEVRAYYNWSSGGYFRRGTSSAFTVQ